MSETEQQLQAFWIDEVGYGDYIWHERENKVTITETNCSMNTVWGLIMTDAHYLDPYNWRTQEKPSFWARDNMLGPFRTRKDAEFVVTEIMIGKRAKLQAEIDELRENQKKMTKWQLIHDKYEPRES